MAPQMTPALAALGEKIFVQAVAQAIVEGDADRSYEEYADQAFEAAAAFIKTGQVLSRR